MHVCQYCSQENSTTGPCQRCGVEGNPSGTPWGIRKRRDTKYWHKYNWDNRVFVGKEERDGKEGFNAQEQANFDNFNEIKRVIRPGKISSANHLTVREPLAGSYFVDITVPELEGAETVTPAPIPFPNGEELPTFPDGIEEPEILTPEEEEEHQEHIREVVRAFTFVPKRTSVSNITLSDEGKIGKLRNINVLKPTPETQRNMHKLFVAPRKVLVDVGMWSLGEDAFRQVRGIGNVLPKTKDQTKGTCYAFGVTDIVDWYVNEENAAMYTARLYPIVNRRRGDGSEGGNPSDAWLGLELNQGRIAEPILPGTNQDPNGQSVLDMTVPEINQLMSNEAQPYNVPSSPKHYNIWEHRPHNINRSWEIVCSSIYQGIPMSMLYRFRDSWYEKKKYWFKHHGPKDGYNHVVSIYGVAITKLGEKPALPEVKHNPYNTKWQGDIDGNIVELTFPSEFHKFLKEAKKVHSNFKAKKYKDKHGWHLQFNDQQWNSLSDAKKVRINELIRDYFDRFLPFDYKPSPVETPEETEETEETKQKVEQPKQFTIIVENDTKPPKDPNPTPPLDVYEGRQRWLLVHNSWGEKWKYRGWAWVQWDKTLVDDIIQINGRHEVTATNHGPINNPSPQMEKASTPVQMRPRSTSSYQPTGYAYTKPELIVALDIDDTLVDTSQRMRSAQRMGLYDPRQVGKKQHPKGREAFREFFYSAERFHLDKVMAGTVDFARDLVQKGYKVAYITGRPDYVYELTKQQLKHMGFPITKDKYGADLLYCKPEAAKSTSAWKKTILSSLQSNYDLRFFFDNNPKNLEVGRQLGIPGLYLAIDQYTGITDLANRFKKVPLHIDNPNHSLDVSSYRVAAGCIVQRATDKKVLLLRRSPKETSMHGLYELPGGKLEEGETPRQTAKVETKEEAGLDVKIVKEITPVHVDHDMQKCYHCFLARPKKGAKVVLSEEHDHYMWVTPQEALTMTEPLSHHAEHFFRIMTGMMVNPHFTDYEEGSEEEEIAQYQGDTWANPGHVDEEEEMYRDMFDDSPYANPEGVLPIMTGEPTGKHTKLGSVFSEVFIGRNIGADVGEVVQAIYRGIIGGRTSMAEKRMAMAVATMQKELSDNAAKLGGNAVANLKVDYEIPKGTASVTLIAHGDAIKTSTVRNNPSHKDGTKLYKDFNGKAPDVVQATTITIPTTLVRVGEGGCWSVGYRSDKEGHGKNQKYIHEFGDFGRFPKKKPKKGHRKEPDLYAALDENGNVIDLRIIGGTFSLDVDPDSGINWLVG